MSSRLTNQLGGSHSEHANERPSQKTGMVFLVGAGPGDPGLITLRAVECLNQADVVIYDRLINCELLGYAPQADWIDVGKHPNHHPVPQDKINALLVEQSHLGRTVVRLKGGDPFVFGRGGEEALALVEADIPFEIVPGITSAVAVPAYAGIPVTQRGLACSVAFVTGHRSETAEKNGGASELGLSVADTRVFLMGVQNLPAIVRQLLAEGCVPDTPVAVIERGTLPDQKVVLGTLRDIVERSAGVHPPAITVVGEVVRLREKLAWFDRREIRPLFGLRILNTRPLESQTRDDLTRRLQLLGAEVLSLPATRLAPAPDLSDLDGALLALARKTGVDWILFTSANAVHFTLHRLFELGFDARCLAGVKLGAVGEATARALRAYHLKADFVPTRFTGLDWAAEVGDIAGQCVLLPRSELAAPELVRALEQRGAHVVSVIAYAVEMAEPDEAVLSALLAGEIDVVAFFSPSAVAGLLEMIERKNGAEAAESAFRGRVIACIGSTTAEAARRAGLRVDLVPQEHTVNGMVEALLKWRAP